MSTESRADRRIHGDNSPCRRHTSSISLKRHWMDQHQWDFVRNTTTSGACSAPSSSTDVTSLEGSKKSPPMQPTKLQQLTTVPMQLLVYALNLLMWVRVRPHICSMLCPCPFALLCVNPANSGILRTCSHACVYDMHRCADALLHEDSTPTALLNEELTPTAQLREESTPNVPSAFNSPSV